MEDMDFVLQRENITVTYQPDRNVIDVDPEVGNLAFPG